MSLASRQSLSLLAVVHGCLTTIDSYDLAPELSPTVHYGIEVSEQCIMQFPETGNKDKNNKWMVEKIHLIDDDLQKSESLYTMILLTSLAHQIVTDLSEKIHDKVKLEQIKIVEEVIYSISDKIDKNKDQFKAYEEADRILKKLYNYLEFTR